MLNSNAINAGEINGRSLANIKFATMVLSASGAFTAAPNRIVVTAAGWAMSGDAVFTAEKQKQAATEMSLTSGSVFIPLVTRNSAVAWNADIGFVSVGAVTRNASADWVAAVDITAPALVLATTDAPAHRDYESLVIFNTFYAVQQPASGAFAIPGRLDVFYSTQTGF
jgi:hypothetical protein|tara:strand:+ start:301 stop:804 length:504 start_codon:yes stop_codon:yes gene_type:complete